MIIGIDPGLNISAIYQGSKSVVLDNTMLKSKCEKLNRVYNFFCSCFRSYTITNVFLEEVAHGAKYRVADLGAVNGVILLAARRSGVSDPILVPSTKWKHVVFGDGSISKDGLKRRVERHYKKHFESQHEYDAFCIWRYGAILGRKI